jgi:SAM-dependent methyltransferase/uncharacterized protein YbaR (Trm112 family)
MTTLADLLHCPHCKGRVNVVAAASITGTPAGSLFCTVCEAIVPAPDGIVDFVGSRLVTEVHPSGFFGDPYLADEEAGDLRDRLLTAAGSLWPAGLGDVLELGCGGGRMTRALALELNNTLHSLVAVDTSGDALRACRDRLGQTIQLDTLPISFVRLGLDDNVIRDATFDTVLGLDVLTRTGDPAALFRLIHRILRPGGRAFLVAPSRRFAQALCHAMADALVLRHAREQTWSDPARSAIHMIGLLYQRHIHHGNAPALAHVRDKQLYQPEELADLALETGFDEIATIPLEPDQAAADSTLRLCRTAGVDAAFAAEIAPMVASVGAPHFNLLARADSSPTMLVCLTKGIGPALRTFARAPKPSPIGVRQPEAALGGVPPRWSIEITARDTPEGIQLSVDGWCLVNADVLWVRMTIDGVTRVAAMGHPRPDVHDVLNRQGLYHPLYALCSGLRATVQFEGVHSRDSQFALRIEVALASGIIVQSAAPRMLVINETVTIAQ